MTIFWLVCSFCLSVRLSVCPSVRLSICPSVRLSVCPSVRLSVCLLQSRNQILSFTAPAGFLLIQGLRFSILKLTCNYLEAMCISYISMFMLRLDIYAAEPWYHVTSVTLTIQCLQLQHVRANKASLQSQSVSSFTTPPTTKSRAPRT